MSISNFSNYIVMSGKGITICKAILVSSSTSVCLCGVCVCVCVCLCVSVCVCVCVRCVDMCV